MFGCRRKCTGYHVSHRAKAYRRCRARLPPGERGRGSMKSSEGHAMKRRWYPRALVVYRLLLPGREREFEAAEKWWENAKLKIPGALPFATRSGNVCGDSAELPAPGEQWSPGVSLHGSRGRRYFRNFADISEAVGLEFSGRRCYTDTTRGRPCCNAIWLRNGLTVPKIECIGIVRRKTHCAISTDEPSARAP